MDKVTCRLVDISSFYTVSQRPPDFSKLEGVEFEINPVGLERSITASYSQLTGIGSRQSVRQYLSSTRNPIILSGCIIHSKCIQTDKQKYLDKFEQLLFSKTPNTHPSILALVFGARVIQPTVLTELKISETSWSNGLISSGTFDLTLEYIHPNRKTPRVTQNPKPTKREEAKKKNTQQK